MQGYLVFLAATALAVLYTLSLLAKNEGLRGMGRVCDGVSRIFFACFIFEAAHFNHQLPSVFIAPAVVLGVLGVVTFFSGLRKWLRRNAAS